jgi:hypothetical protein
LVIWHLIVWYFNGGLVVDEKFKTLALTNTESLFSIEAKVAQLNDGFDYKLRFPATLNTKGALGTEVAVMQLLGTWLSEGSYKKVFHSYQEASSTDFKKLCSSLYGIATLALADEIWDKEGNILPRTQALAGAVGTIENLRNRKFSECFKSRYFGVPCIKKPTYDREFDMPIYNNGDVIGSAAFHKFIQKIISDQVGSISRFPRLDEAIGINDLSDLIWEVFKNTHDHGRVDKLGNNLPLNFRGLIIQQQDLSEDYLDLWCGDNPSEAQMQFRANWNGIGEKRHILDLSIIDFGMGFVELAKDKAHEDDNIDILLKCLEQGWTRLQRKNRGEGLTKVLNNINRHRGWLRIRTGNLLLEKAYSSSDKVDISRQDVCELDHSVRGTSVHISIPLNRNVLHEGG